MNRIPIVALLGIVGALSTAVAQTGEANDKLADVLSKKLLCELNQSDKPDSRNAILAQSQCGPPGCCGNSKCICERKSDGSVAWCTTK